MNDKKFKRFVIDYYCNLPKILERLDIDVKYNGLFFCPLHDNYNTPAAKLYKDLNGWHFYCYSEQRMYGSYDVYEKRFNYNMDQVFNEVWNKLNETEKASMKDLFGDYDEGSPAEDIDLYQAFHLRQIDYRTLIQELEKRELNK